MKSGQLARSIYIHIPFCSHKCHYCDFYSFVDTRDRQGVFAARLEQELEAISVAAGPIDTIFVGGGTPSMLEVPLWEGLLGRLNDCFDLSPIRSDSRPDAGEFTVECNPESVTPELMATLRAGGVSRISMGAQSFQNAHLKTLERLHDPGRVPRAVEMAKTAGIDRVSLDLIFAIPGQTIEDLARDLDEAPAVGEFLDPYREAVALDVVGVLTQVELILSRRGDAQGVVNVRTAVAGVPPLSH